MQWIIMHIFIIIGNGIPVDKKEAAKYFKTAADKRLFENYLFIFIFHFSFFFFFFKLRY